MDKHDYLQFSTLLDDAYDMIGSGANKFISDSAKAMFFRAVSRYSIEVFRAALEAHIMGPDGIYTPKPAHIVAQIEGMAANDGRPNDDEAWAIAITARDEADTVVWTTEIADAFAQCRSLLDLCNDVVAARMAFKGAYARSVTAARAARQPVRWSACLGWDQAKRHTVLEKAARFGLLAAPALLAIAHNPIGEPLPDAHARTQIAQVRAMLAYTNAELNAAANRKNEAAWDAEQAISDRVADQVASYTTAQAGGAKMKMGF